jgi:hypothetical protein
MRRNSRIPQRPGPQFKHHLSAFNPHLATLNPPAHILARLVQMDLALRKLARDKVRARQARNPTAQNGNVSGIRGRRRVSVLRA